jgi:hypothetical protein
VGYALGLLCLDASRPAERAVIVWVLVAVASRFYRSRARSVTNRNPKRRDPVATMAP